MHTTVEHRGLSLRHGNRQCMLAPYEQAISKMEIQPYGASCPAAHRASPQKFFPRCDMYMYSGRSYTNFFPRCNLYVGFRGSGEAAPRPKFTKMGEAHPR